MNVYKRIAELERRYAADLDARMIEIAAAELDVDPEELLDGAYMTPTYGNTMMGLAASWPSGPHNGYKITYYAPQPRAVA